MAETERSGQVVLEDAPTDVGGPFHILLVEDNPADVRLVQEGLRDAGIEHRLTVANDGVEAMERLHHLEEIGDPDIILLDLNLPRMGGHEVLQRVKAERRLRRIPVVILTTSAEEADVHEAYLNQVNSFVTKPVGFREFADLIKDLGEYWMRRVTLATRLGAPGLN